jgi:3-hydroxyacyl-[acyl-carrier-protein] dehydratase
MVDTAFDSDTQCIQARFRFNHDLAVFEGHFPDAPIVPGVFQLEIVRATMEAYLGQPLTIRQVRSAKFARKVLPDELLEVDVGTCNDNEYIDVKADVRVDGELAARVSMMLSRKPEGTDSNES